MLQRARVLLSARKSASKASRSASPQVDKELVCDYLKLSELVFDILTLKRVLPGGL